MDAIRSWLTMGGYAAFVWPAYALAFAFLVGGASWAVRSLRAQQQAVRALEVDAPHRRGRAGEMGAP